MVELTVQHVENGVAEIAHRFKPADLVDEIVVDIGQFENLYSADGELGVKLFTAKFFVGGVFGKLNLSGADIARTDTHHEFVETFDRPVVEGKGRTDSDRFALGRRDNLPVVGEGEFGDNVVAVFGRFVGIDQDAVVGAQNFDRLIDIGITEITNRTVDFKTFQLGTSKTDGLRYCIRRRKALRRERSPRGHRDRAH